ncbi:Uu.00g015250.m01.CDS01 [Anthostomella pinea]|uniref:Uu.00g015250.m01.CDS01 n=1 Tax=Anthostomella pinea TaxID=933095 RepID=A0AAI8VSQ2_9PEZI|nr:Uu.00g015250.m01.CDS01 [Anthostomella pinea]
MDCLERTHHAGSASEREAMLADDYMFGFMVKDDVEREFLGHMAVHRGAPEEHMEVFIRHSLLRGIEQFEQMLRCALSLKEKASIENPLDGQDVLTYLGKIFPPPETATEETVEEPSLPAEEGIHTQKPNIGRKRKASSNQQQPGSKAAIKRSKKEKQSPFFLEPQAQSQSQQPSQGESPADKRMGKKARRRTRKARESAGATENTPQKSEPGPRFPVLQEAASWYRSDDNVVAPELAENDTQGSMSGPDDGVPDCTAREQVSDGAELDISPGGPHPSPMPPGMASAFLDTRDAALLAINEDEKPARADKLSESLDDALPPSPISQPLKQTPKRTAKSPYFNTPSTSSPRKPKSPRPPRGTVSCLPFPRLDAPRFGLFQEELADDPFRLLLAVTFLIRTTGRAAIPVFRQVMEKYPTPQDLVDADTDDIVATIRHLGLGVVRAATIQKYARIWLENPPRADVRYGVKNYPAPGDGASMRAGEVVVAAAAAAPEDQNGAGAPLHPHQTEETQDQDPRLSAWEIGHMTQGRYALDSWRIFCRDVLLQRAQDWQGAGREGEFQPEWMRVLPQDKELRAYLRWMYMLEGWQWDPRTGEKEVLSDQLRRAVQEGRVAWDDSGDLKILPVGLDVAG